MEPVTVQLSSPVTDFGKPVESLTIAREVTGKDLLATENMSPERTTMIYIQRLCGISWEAVQAMSVRDISAVEKAMAPFAGIGPMTGGPSSASSPSDTDGAAETS